MVLVLLLAALAPQLASAEGGRATDSRVLDAIRARMQKGESLFLAGKYAEAARAFEEGFKQHPYPAFLFNAGVAYQKLGDLPKALERFRAYVAANPTASDASRVEERITRIEAELAAASSTPDAGVETPTDAGVASDGAAPPPAAANADDPAAMKSLVVIETVPPGAPLQVYVAESDAVAPFRAGGPNPGWRPIAAARSPANLSLDVGRFHLVVEKFRDFNVSQIEFRVRPSYVHHLLANLSQGEFMAFLRVSANVEGAYVFLDDPDKRRSPWGKTPHGELVSGGKHTLRVEAPGFQPFVKVLTLSHGEQKDYEVTLVRVAHGRVTIDANAPEIKVEIDGRPIGVWKRGERPLDVKLASGSHQIVIKSPGYKTYASTLSVPRGRILPLHAELIETYPRGAAWTQAIIGAVFLGAAIYLGVESNNLHDELEADRRAGVLEADDERIARGRWFSIGADIGFAIGGVLAILATYNFIKDPYPESSVRKGRPAEFEDPRAKKPSARAVPSRGERLARRARQRGIELGFGPLISEHAGGFGIGGTF